MDIHKNARLTPLGREHMVNMVLSGQTPKAVSEAVGVCPRTVDKWVKRFQAEGLAGLQDRSSRPDHLRQPTPQVIVDRIAALRRQRLTGKAIATETGVSTATVSRVLKRLGLNRLSNLEPATPPRRYQRERPGELIHIDIKKLGKFNRIGHRITGDRIGQSNARIGAIPIAIEPKGRRSLGDAALQETEVDCAVASARLAYPAADKLMTARTSGCFPLQTILSRPPRPCPPTAMRLLSTNGWAISTGITASMSFTPGQRIRWLQLRSRRFLRIPLRSPHLPSRRGLGGTLRSPPSPASRTNPR